MTSGGRGRRRRVRCCSRIVALSRPRVRSRPACGRGDLPGAHRALDRCVIPLMLRGRGVVEPLAAARHRCGARRAGPRAEGARHAHRHRRRIARSHHARDRRGPAAELRPDSRRRRRDAPGDAAPDVGGSRLGGSRDRQAAAEERRALRERLPAAGRQRDRSGCCPTSASRAAWSGSGSWPRSRTPPPRSAREPSGASLSAAGPAGRCGELAADRSGRAGPRLPRQR